MTQKNEEDRLRRKLKKYDLLLRKDRRTGTYRIVGSLTEETECHCMTLEELETRLALENFENVPLSQL